MKPLGDTTQHYWLAQRMARLHGVDLTQASVDGEMDQAEWAEMVTRCRGCLWTQGCERHLASGELSGLTVDGLPEKCLNRERFAALRTSEEMA